jgi:hypothetical protein
VGVKRRGFLKLLGGVATVSVVSPMLPIPAAPSSTIFPEFDPAIHVISNEEMNRRFARAFFWSKPINELADLSGHFFTPEVIVRRGTITRKRD